MGNEKQLADDLKKSNDSLIQSENTIKELEAKLVDVESKNNDSVEEKQELEASLADVKLEKDNLSQKTKDLEEKLAKGLGKEIQGQIEALEKELAEKDAKIVELAQSVAQTQPPPKRVKLDVPYSNKYTPSQIKAFKKHGISTEHLDVEPEPEEPEITA